MTAELTIFNYMGRDTKIIIDDNGYPWWVAKEISDILGFSNASAATRHLDDDEKMAVKLTAISVTNPNHIIINESGLYSLIFRSSKPEAKAFKKWVTSVVLPEIRKTGTYMINKLSRLEIARMLLAAEEEKLSLEQENKELLPKAASYDKYIDSNGLINLQSIGKILGYNPNLYLKALRDKGILYKRSNVNLPYQKYEDREYFVVKIKNSPYSNASFKQTFATPEGMDWLSKLDIIV